MHFIISAAVAQFCSLSCQNELFLIIANITKNNAETLPQSHHIADTHTHRERERERERETHTHAHIHHNNNVNIHHIQRAI